MSQLRKATRQKAKIRLGLSAVSGGGKTFSALLIAKGITGDLSKVAIIDTENGSADLYAHLGDYNVLPLVAPYTPERYIAAIKECEAAGMEAIIIDSITHEWDGKGGILKYPIVCQETVTLTGLKSRHVIRRSLMLSCNQHAISLLPFVGSKTMN